MNLETLLRTQWDRLSAVVAALAAVVVLIVGWYGVSGTAYPAEQLPYIVSGGIGGLFLLGISSVLWLSADLHDEWRKLDRIERAIRSAGCTHEQNEFSPGAVASNESAFVQTDSQSRPELAGIVEETR